MTNVTGNETNVITLDDTREKLRDDAVDWLKDHSACSTPLMSELDVWLDRQAAIAEREAIERWDGKALAIYTDMKAERDELQAKVDELVIERDRAKSEAKTQRNNFDLATKARAHWKEQGTTLVRLLREDHGLKASWDGLRGCWSIEATEEHKDARDELESALHEMERTWMRLPVDADGVPVRPGDIMCYLQGGNKVHVHGVCEKGIFYTFVHEKKQEPLPTDVLRHFQPDTVESLLEEFAHKMNENMGMYTAESIEADEWKRLDEETMANYAERIRKAVEQ